MPVDCDRCRELLLDSLYGLLDPSEEVALAAHVADCPACRDAKAEAAKAQALFAVAAKLPFPDVKFEIPVEAVPAVAAKPERRSYRWAIAAGLMVASLALLSPAIRDYSDYRDRHAAMATAARNRTEIENRDADRVDVQNRLIAGFEKELGNLRESHKQRIKTWVSAEAAASSRPFHLEVSGPVAAIPGALNEYTIVAKAGDKAIPISATAVVRDARGTEYFKKTLPATESILRLPSSLWAKFPAGAEDLILAVSATNDAGATAELSEPIQLLAPVFTTLVVTDKPLYRPGERIFFRSLTLNRTNLQPPSRDLSIRFELRKPDGTALAGATVTGTTQPVMNRDGIDTPVAGPDGQPVRGIACGVVGLPETLPGGEYVLTAFELPAGWTGAELPKGSTPIGTRKLTVAKYQPEVLTKTLEFDAKTYGPGDAVKAKLTVRNQGKPLANIGLIVAAVHGNNVKIPVKQPGQLKADGTAEIELTLPNLPDLKNPSLTVTILDQNMESIVRRIPLASKSLAVEFFPEGGELIEGLSNRVYVRAMTSTGSPADFAGTITDGTRTICDVKTLTDPEHPGVNQGLGVFSFTPESGKRYALKLQRPAGTAEPPIKVAELAKVTAGYLLPKAEADGVTLSIPNGVIDANRPLKATVTSAKTKRNLIVGVYTRGLVVGHKTLTVEPGKPADVSIAPPAVAIGGVTRVTVFEEPAANAGRTDLVPLAERLVFRRPAEKLKLAYAADKTSYSPGDRVTLRVTATDETDKPAAAVLMAAVVNQSVVAMADDKAERLLPTHFLLAGELQNPEQIEHADFVLTNHPKAAETLDLLLGTQGWRRFAEANGEFKSSSVSDAEKQRFWVANGRMDRMTEAVRPDRATAKQLEATGSIDARLDQLEAKKSAAEMERDRKPDNWRAARNAETIEAGAADRAWTQARFKFLAGLAGIVLLAAFVLVWRYLKDRNLRSTLVVLGLSALGLFLIALALKDQFKMSAQLNAPPPMSGAEMREEPPRTDLRETGNAVPPPDAGGPQPPTRSDIGPAPPTPRAMASERKRFEGNLHTNRADRAVRAVSDADLSGAEMAALDRVRKALVRHAPFVVREYAHLPRKSDDDTRVDFTETVYWHPVLVLPNDGKLDLNFHVSDATNGYRVMLSGHTLDGRLGSATGHLEVRKPLEVDAKLPPELSTADRPLVPVVASNATDKAIDAKIGYWSDHLVADAEDRSMIVPASSGSRRLVPVKPQGPGPARVRVSASGGGRFDASERTVQIVPDGFPVSGASNFDLTGRAKTTIAIPDKLVPKTLSVKVQVFANSLADIQSGLAGLIREPHGCFEQTSSANYPNVLALQYLKDANQLHGTSADQARGMLDRGLARLASFEVQPPLGAKQGFEWFGAHPAHECLTAYGLVQFADMARVVPVDPKLIERTKAFLLARRDRTGGFARKKDAHSFGDVPDAVANAYIAWAIHSADPTVDLALEAKAVADEAMKSGDPYRLALAANLSAPAELLKALAAKQKDDGSFPGAQTSITRSRGRDLVVESTALAALAFQNSKSPEYAANLASAIRFLVQSREAHGPFGGTQATVLALKAIVAYNQAHRRPSESGEIIVRIGKSEVARLPFNSDDLRPVEAELETGDRFPAGQHELSFESQAKQPYPVSVSWSAYCRTPATAADAPLDLSATLADAEVVEGASTRLNVTVTNRETTDTGMAVAIVGLPAGLTFPPDFQQLKALTAKPAKGEPTLSHWELNGRELALYWRALGPKQVVELSLDLVATLPGEFRGPASRAYLYYGSESKRWLDPLAVRIKPRD